MKNEHDANKALSATSARLAQITPTPAEMARAAARKAARSWLRRLFGI